MRVTNRSMTRNYLNNVNRNLSLYNQSGARLQHGRKFTKMSENVSDGTRALNVRTQMYKNDQVQENAHKASESLSQAESNMMSIEDILNSVHEQTIKAVNGTNEGSSDIFAINFDTLKKQVVEFANCRYNNTYVLGGTNNQSAPFELKDNGELFYNGVSVGDIEKTDGVFYSNGDKVPYSDNVYMDIGIGLSVKNGVVDPRSAFNMSVSGLDALGYGKSDITYSDREGVEHTINVSNNAVELLGEMSKAFEEKDFDKAIALNDHLRKTIDGLVTEIADVGVRTNYLDNNIGRLENEEDNLVEIQSNLEYINDTDELINHSMLSYSWLLTLQYGGKVIPQSLMDYIQG